MKFTESLEYLYGLGSEVLAMKLGLENIGKLLKALGNPEKKYLKVQVAGTNGKGSTVAFLEAVCLAAGIETGATVSPHLISITERIRVGGREISEADFARLATRVREISEELVAAGELESVPTYFEQITAIALLAFSEKAVGLAILETGLGGRFDAMTAARAEIVALTAIDEDHQQILGETLAEIAAEKASIIRKDTKTIVAPQKKEAARVILDRCHETAVEPVLVSGEYQLKINQRENELPRIAVDFATENDVYHDLVLGLTGRHQVENALVAVSVAESLREFGFHIEKEHIWTGLENARHRGRLELFAGILFDGAHNVAGATALGNFLDEFVGRPVTIIFGAVRDKDLKKIAEILFPRAARLVLTRADNPRSAETAELFEFLPENFVVDKVHQAATVAAALQKAWEITPEGDLIVATGSLYLIGEAQKLLNNDFEI